MLREEASSLLTDGGIGAAVMIVGDALAAHYRYGDQGKLDDTDVLPRYQSLAKDRACLSH